MLESFGEKAQYKHVYDTIAFTSMPVQDGAMNLFKGFVFKSNMGDCRRAILALGLKAVDV